MKLLLSAGEASGEMYGAQLMEALRRRDPSLEFMGVGGERMRAAGCPTVVDARDVAVLGLGEVVTHLPRIWVEFRRLLRAIDRARPDAAVLIDFPDWNLRLARQLHRRGIPVVYYVSPQLWAWRPGRIELVRRYVRKMLVIFPFEEQWYRERGIEAEFVGHPLASPVSTTSTWKSMALNGPLDKERMVALLPGSRHKEIAMNLPTMLRAAFLFGPEYRFILPVPGTVAARWVSAMVERYAPPGRRGHIAVMDSAWAALKMCRAAIVASGTATVEAAIAGTPFVMVYRVSPLTWKLGRPLVNVPHFAMVNLIAGREVVPELVQRDFTAENVVAKLQELIPDGPARARMLAGLAEVRDQLKAGSDRPAADRAAEAILRALKAVP
jgi:lipid-A-disaccharide synthase